MSQSRTLAGSHIALSAATPATYDAAGYAALSWTQDACSLVAVPDIGRTFAGVTRDVVCEKTSKTKKGKASHNPVSINMHSDWNNGVQTMLETAEASTTAVISVRIQFPLADGGTTPDTVYFTVQVAKFGTTSGGSGDTIDQRACEMWIQSDEVIKVAAT